MQAQDRRERVRGREDRTGRDGERKREREREQKRRSSKASDLVLPAQMNGFSLHRMQQAFRLRRDRETLLTGRLTGSCPRPGGGNAWPPAPTGVHPFTS